jgi:hypothetical protein
VFCLPASTGQHQDRWAFFFAVKRRFVDVAEFLLTGHHLEQRGRGEDRQDVHEVSPTKGRFTFRGKRQDAVVAPEDSLGHHEINEFGYSLGRHLRKAGNILDPRKPL